MAGRLAASAVAALPCLLAGAGGILVGAFSGAGGGAGTVVDALSAASLLLPLLAFAVALWLVWTGPGVLALLPGPATFARILAAHARFAS